MRYALFLLALLAALPSAAQMCVGGIYDETAIGSTGGFDETFDSGALDGTQWPQYSKAWQGSCVGGSNPGTACPINVPGDTTCTGGVCTSNGGGVFNTSSPTPRAGANAFKFTVVNGDLVNSGERAELLHTTTDVLGAVGWYALSFYVPVAYDDEGSALFQIITQWHGDDVPASPMETLQIQQATVSPSTNIAFAVKMRKASASLGLITFTNVTKGAWHDVVVKIKWAQDATGYMSVWLDGAPFVTNEFGQTLPSASSNPALFSFGLYRDSALTATNSVYFDELSTGPNVTAAVCAAGGGAEVDTAMVFRGIVVQP